MTRLIDQRTISSELAQTMVDHAIDVAGIPVGVAVVGVGGDLVAFRRADGAPLIAETVARDKAYSSAVLGGTPTATWSESVGALPGLVHGLTNVDRIMIFGGGVPVVVDGTVVGAVGVSGGTAEQDAAAAQSAAELAAG